MRPAPTCLVLDSQGLSEAARGVETVRGLIRAAKGANKPVVVSALTLAEVLRGHPRDAAVHLALRDVTIGPVTAEIGRAAGELLGRTGRKDTVDAVVVVTAAALSGSVVIVTSDPADIGALAEGMRGVGVLLV